MMEMQDATDGIVDIYPKADSEANSITNLKTVDKNAGIVQGIVKTNNTSKQHYIKIRERWSLTEKYTLCSLAFVTISIGIVEIIFPAANYEDNTLLITLGVIGVVCGIIASILTIVFKNLKRTNSLMIALYNKKIDMVHVIWKRQQLLVLLVMMIYK